MEMVFWPCMVPTSDAYPRSYAITFFSILKKSGGFFDDFCSAFQRTSSVISLKVVFFFSALHHELMQ